MLCSQWVIKSLVIKIRKGKNSGKVGIWTATPGEVLTVNGNVSATAFYYLSDVRLKMDLAFNF